MMKKINIYIAILFATFLATSCNDYLDVDSPSAMDEATVYSTEELANLGVMSISVSFGETNSYRSRFLPFYGLNTDLEYYNNSEKNDDRAQLATYTTTPGNGQMNTLNNAWAKMYEGVERANIAIRGLTNSGLAKPQTPFGHLLAEAYTLRAVLYLDLTRAWGDVPARFQPLTNETIYMPKADRDDIYKQLIADLEFAATLAYWPNESTKYTSKSNRINKTFIKALRARICMVAAGYAQRPDSDAPRQSNDPELSKDKMYKIAERELLSLYENPAQAGGLNASFEDIFKKLCEEDLTAGKESLWQIPFSDGRGRMAYTFAIRHQVSDQYTKLAKGGDVGPTPNLFYDYDIDDLRRDVTCVPYRWSASSSAVQELNKLNSWNFGKYRFEWMSRRVTSDNDDGLNKQYMRFAEVVLMLAEIKNELEGPSAAAPYLKALRQRAFPADKQATKVEAYVNALSSKEAMFEAIVDEHAFEFAGEMLRKEALIRWNLLGDKLRETKAKMYDLRSLTGEYADVPATVYYRNVEAYVGDRNKEKLEFYGFNRGELGTPPSADFKSKDWIKESELKDDKIESLFDSNTDPDKRQFWPLWEVFIESSNGVLKNDYGY